MFTINLYEMNKRENSTRRPSGNGVEMQCEAHEPIDLIRPTLLINLLVVDNYNYVYVSAWDRYYWIDDWTYNKGIWEAVCSIDPLASWRNSIGNMTEYVLRSSAQYDGGILDTTYPLTGEVHIEQNFSTWRIGYNPHGCYVIGVVGLVGLTEYYVIGEHEIGLFGAAMFGDTLWNAVRADDPGASVSAASFMKAQFNPLQYVVSCMWFPFEVPHSNVTSSVFFGYFDSGLVAYTLDRTAYLLFDTHISLSPHPQAEDRGYYLNLAPYSRLRLSALPWGEVDLDTTKFFGQNTIMYLEAWVDPVTGSTKLYVQNSSGVRLLTLVGQIGVPEQLSQVLKDNLATVTGGLSAVAGLVGSLTTGNVVGAISSVASGIGNAVAAQYPDVSTTGTNGARIAVAPTSIYVTQTFQYILDEDWQNRGRPLCQRWKIADLPGYLLIADPDVELPATKAEIQQIKDYMEHGFFYE